MYKKSSKGPESAKVFITRCVLGADTRSTDRDVETAVIRVAFRHSVRLAMFSMVLVMLAGGLNAQQSVAPPLADYVGTYADAPSHTLEFVDGDGLIAVVDEAKYPLRPSGVDQFTTITGQTVTFPRDASGKVTGYEQNGKFHPRVTTAITPETAALARPRPKGQDTPADYRYHPPADLHDGIAVGDIAHSDLGVATASAIVRRDPRRHLQRRAQRLALPAREAGARRVLLRLQCRAARNSSGLQPSPSSARWRGSPSTAAPSRESASACCR